MRVEPPTKMTWSILPLSSAGVRDRLLDGHLASAFEQVRRHLLELGPGERTGPCGAGPRGVAAMNGKLIWVSLDLAESSILAFSATSLRRCMAMQVVNDRSTP